MKRQTNNIYSNNENDSVIEEEFSRSNIPFRTLKNPKRVERLRSKYTEEGSKQRTSLKSRLFGKKKNKNDVDFKVIDNINLSPLSEETNIELVKAKKELNNRIVKVQESREEIVELENALKQKHKSLEKEMAKLEKEYISLEEKKKSFDKEVITLEKREKENLVKKRQLIKTLDIEIVKLEKGQQARFKELDHVESELAIREAKIKITKEQLAKKDEKNLIQRAKIERDESLIAKRERDLKRLSKELSAVEKTNLQLLKKQREQKIDLDSKQKELDNLEKELKRKEKELKRK